MDRTSWKPKIYKTDETVDYKATEADQSEVNDYLDILRESGVTNMFGAGSYIEEEFGVDGQEARKLLQNWMENFGKSNEGDPDFDNDPDFEGKINGVSVEPSQYTQSGMDHTDYSRGDIDTESKANEDDHKKSWSELDSIAKMGFSDIGYDQQSWDSEPEEVRAEMETVVKDNMSQENWKEVANKIYKEELNKGKKSGGEGLIPYQELLNHTRVDKEGDFVLCNYCNQTYDLGEMDELIDNNTITKHLHGHGIRSPVVTAYDVLKDTESKANEDVGDSWYTRIVKCGGLKTK